jgi:dihydrofolate reductase
MSICDVLARRRSEATATNGRPDGARTDSIEEMIMGTIAVHEFMTLDGVIEDPSWSFGLGFDPRMGQAIGAVMSPCRAILLGRRTYEMFHPAWSIKSAADDPGAPFFNDTSKYVVSSTLSSADWANSTILGPYSADAIRGLKERVDGGIYVSGSGTLVRSLLADGLVDELHLFMYPVALGAGQRLFAGDAGPIKFDLAGTEVYDNGAIHLDYRPAKTATTT